MINQHLSGSKVGAAREFCSTVDKFVLVSNALSTFVATGAARVHYAKVLTWATLCELQSTPPALHFAVSKNRAGECSRLQSMLHPGDKVVKSNCASSTPSAHAEDNDWARGADNVRDWMRSSIAFRMRAGNTYTKDTIALLVALADFCTAELRALGGADTIGVAPSAEDVVTICESISKALSAASNPTNAKVAVRAATRLLDPRPVRKRKAIRPSNLVCPDDGCTTKTFAGGLCMLTVAERPATFAERLAH